MTTASVRFLRAALLVGAAFSMFAIGCNMECDDGSDPGADCICDDGSAATNCRTEIEEAMDEEDETVGGLRAAGVVETVGYGSDAISVDFFGCARIGDSHDAVCALDLTGSGFDWQVQLPLVVGGCDPGIRHGTAIDDTGMEYHTTSVKIAGEEQSTSICFARTLVEGIATEARVRFDGVHSGAAAFALLQLPIAGKSTQLSPGKETLMFRDVPLE